MLTFIPCSTLIRAYVLSHVTLALPFSRMASTPTAEIELIPSIADAAVWVQMATLN